MFVGADIEQLNTLAKAFNDAALELERMTKSVHQAAAGSAWKGQDADTFRNDWNGKARGMLNNASTTLRQASETVRQNAKEQAQASGLGAGGTGRQYGHMRYPVDNNGVPAPAFDPSDLADQTFAYGGWGLLAEQGRNLPGDYARFRKTGEMSRFGLGDIVSAAELGYDLREYGAGDARTWGTGVSWGGSKLAGLTPAGPAGEFAFSASYSGTAALLQATGGDRVLAEAGWATLYGDRGDMTPTQAAELTRRTGRPDLLFYDSGRGIARGFMAGARSLFR